MPFKRIKFILLTVCFVPLMIFGCGGGGSGGTSSAASPSLNITSNAAINATTSHDAQIAPLRVNRASFTVGFLGSAMTYADVNGDGHLDIFVAPAYYTGTTGNSPPTNVRMYINDGTGHYALNDAVWETPIPATLYGRKAITGDYNGDGIPDFAVMDHGGEPPCVGAPPVVLLSTSTGTYTKATGLDTLVGFHHGGASGDIDNNGTVDIFVTAGGGVSGYPMFLINDGHGNFTVNTDRVPSELTVSVPFFSAELVDVDGDGYLDLIVGGVEPSLPTTIYWGSSSGRYSSASMLQLPSVAGFPDPLDFDARDLDGDGKRDLLITRTSNSYQGYAIQYLHNDGSRIFTDVTASKITGSSLSTGGWIMWVSVGDVNGDGFVDIYTQNTSTDMNNVDAVWINDGSGHYSLSASTASTLPIASMP